MAFGGIYDHVGGGFARYSTDEEWRVPHFEKMLYDNAQLVSLYSHAFQLTGDPDYRQVVFETLEFIRQAMTSEEGGFYSSIDADSEGEEGRFYVWSQQEIEKALGPDAALIMDYYNVTGAGNWERGKNILFRTDTDPDFARRVELNLDEWQEKVRAAKARMQEERDHRVRPGLDDKILTSWNALMIKGYTDAFRVFGNPEYLEAALKNAAFLERNAIRTGVELMRNHKDGRSSIQGFLDDYAFTISAFIGLYQATFDEKWLEISRGLAEYALRHFYDSRSGMFFYTNELTAELIARSLEISDNVIPGSNSEMASNLFALGHYFNEETYIGMARQMITNVREELHKHLYYYSNWAILELKFIHKPFEVAILGDGYRTARAALDKHYLPFMYLSGGDSEGRLELLQGKLVAGQTTCYVCRDKVCDRPTTRLDEVLVQLRGTDIDSP
jgi:uncharacterized protein YyaL (SSP411 family)